VLERVRNVMQRHNSIKINTVFNDEFITGDKRANKSITTRNYKLFNMSDSDKNGIYKNSASRVVEPILASLEDLQERDSG